MIFYFHDRFSSISIAFSLYIAPLLFHFGIFLSWLLSAILLSPPILFCSLHFCSFISFAVCIKFFFCLWPVAYVRTCRSLRMEFVSTNYTKSILQPPTDFILFAWIFAVWLVSGRALSLSLSLLVIPVWTTQYYSITTLLANGIPLNWYCYWHNFRKWFIINVPDGS